MNPAIITAVNHYTSCNDEQQSFEKQQPPSSGGNVTSSELTTSQPNNAPSFPQSSRHSATALFRRTATPILAGIAIGAATSPLECVSDRLSRGHSLPLEIMPYIKDAHTRALCIGISYAALLGGAEFLKQRKNGNELTHAENMLLLLTESLTTYPFFVAYRESMGGNTTWGEAFKKVLSEFSTLKAIKTGDGLKKLAIYTAANIVSLAPLLFVKPQIEKLLQNEGLSESNAKSIATISSSFISTALSNLRNLTLTESSPMRGLPPAILRDLFYGAGLSFLEDPEMEKQGALEEEEEEGKKTPPK